MSINRVVTNTPSQLYGTLTSNGKVVLVNQAGIAVGAGALVDTAGFTASAVGMTDADALNGRLRFSGDGLGTASGALTVQGNIIARGGDVVLIAPSIELAQTAVVESQGGSVVLAAGQSVEVTGRGLEGITLQVQAPTDQAVNLGTLKGDAVGIFAGTLRHSGLIQTTAVSAEGGKVVLQAVQRAEVGGAIQALSRSGVGGQVHVTADTTLIKSVAVLDVSGAAGGGEILVGGGWQGKDVRIANGRVTVAESGSVLKANAIEAGNGGTVVVWADETTRVGSRIEARGGTLGGNGGHVETSGKGQLVFRASVDTSAPNGKAGYLLLDPLDITIANGTSAADDAFVTDGVLNNVEVNASTNATISETALEGFTGNITLQASQDVIFSNLSDNLLNLAGVAVGNAFTISAGRNISGADVADRIQTNGGGVVFSTSNGYINLGGILTKGGGITLNAGGTSGNVIVRQLSTTPTGGNGGNISLTSGGYATLGGGGDISALFGGTGVTGNVSVTSGGSIAMLSGSTLRANQLRLTAVGGINNSSTGAATIQAAQLNASNSGSGNINISHTGTTGMLVSDWGAYGYGVRNTVSGADVTINSTQSTLTVAAAATVTANAGNIYLVADSMDLLGTVNSGSSTTGTVTLKPWNNGTAIHLGSGGGPTAGVLELSDAELDRVTSGVLKLGASGYTAGISIQSAISIVSGAVTNLSLINEGTITQGTGATIAVTSLNADGKAGVTLAENNDVVNLAGQSLSGNFSFKDVNALNIGVVDIISGVKNAGGGAGTITLNAGGQLTQSNGAPVNAGSGTLTVTSVGGMNLDLGTGNIAGKVNLTNATSGNISLAIQPPTGLTIMNATSPGSIKIESSKGVTIDTGATVVASGTGSALIIGAATGLFINNVANAANFGAPNGRYLLYLNDPTVAHNFGIFTLTGTDFKQYNAGWTTTALQTTGNGRLFAVAPTLSSSLLGSASKFFDGTTSIDLAGTSFGILSGYIDGDQMGAINGGTGVLASASIGTGIGLTVSGMTLTGVRNSTNTYTVYGYKVASVSANVATIKASMASANSQSVGNAVASFAETFAAVVSDPQGTETTKDQKDERAKDAVVVEADICRP
jgi:hypothetical protein